MSDTRVLSEGLGGKERGASAPVTGYSLCLLPFAASVLYAVLAISTCRWLALGKIGVAEAGPPSTCAVLQGLQLQVRGRLRAA